MLFRFLTCLYTQTNLPRLLVQRRHEAFGGGKRTLEQAQEELEK